MAVFVSLIIQGTFLWCFLKEAHRANFHLEELVWPAYISDADVHEGEPLGPLCLVQYRRGGPIVGPHLATVFNNLIANFSVAPGVELQV